MSQAEPGNERRTPLYDLHVELGARMVPFAGYSMPVQYEGIVAEHLHTRSSAGLFDVSHMGQVLVSGQGAVQKLERLLPVDLEALPQDHCCYTFFTSESGGVLDDLIVTRRGDTEFMLVLNAACAEADLAHLRAHLAASEVEHFPSQALLALQGPGAQAALQALLPELAGTLSALKFMRGVNVQLQLGDAGSELPGSVADSVPEFVQGIDAYISRSGYTGEDGFEVSLPGDVAEDFARALLALPAVQPVGLGARDTLRLEASLCLYGHDLNETISPIEAGLGWSIDKSRRRGGAKAGGFPGAEIVLKQMDEGAPRKRIGLTGEGRAPVREGATVVDTNGNDIGIVCSGGFSPSLERPIAMAYVHSDAIESLAGAIVRGKQRQLTRSKMPFVAHQYKRN